MTKIAIFGDSFADENHSNLDEKSWIDILRDNGLEVHNFSLSGTSLMWSYQKYLNFKKSDQNETIDKIIFLFTEPNRMTTQYKNKIITITHPDMFDDVIKNNNDFNQKDIEILQNFKNYYIYFHNEEEAKIINNLIKRDILSDSRVIYSEPFDRNLPKGQISLYNVASIELDVLTGLSEDDGYKFMNKCIDNRKCHMSEPNNVMVGKKFLDAIFYNKQTIEIFLNDFVQPFNKAKQYFIPR
jgi:hypothetical protein